jgi:hypothetical protein
VRSQRILFLPVPPSAVLAYDVGQDIAPRRRPPRADLRAMVERPKPATKFASSRRRPDSERAADSEQGRLAMPAVFTDGPRGADERRERPGGADRRGPIRILDHRRR